MSFFLNNCKNYCKNSSHNSRLKYLNICKLTLLTIALFPCYSYAAIDGKLGASSSGEVAIDLVLGSGISITGIDNVSFDNWGGSGSLTNIDDVCVYSTTTKYQITANGTTMASDSDIFAISGGDDNSGKTHFIPYIALWNDVNKDSGAKELKPGRNLRGQSGANREDVECNGVSNSRIIIKFSKKDLIQATSGEYSGTLTLAVSPE